MNKTTIAALISLTGFFSCMPAVTAAEKMVEAVHAISVTESDYKLLEENNSIMKEHQDLVEKILAKKGVSVHRPVLPKYRILSANSVQTVINQLDYLALALKIDAKIPAKPEMETGPSLDNNLFLQKYNNALLRSIATKIGAESPKPADLKKPSLIASSNILIKENSTILKAIAAKLGVSDKK